jgi:hypothetical protein
VTPGRLFEKLSPLAMGVVDDPRWQAEKDDLGVTVFGMILYGYGLAIASIIMVLERDDINTAVTRCIVDAVGAAPKWSSGLVEEAARSALDTEHNPGAADLISTGWQYIAEPTISTLVDNVFANIRAIRSQIEE